MTDQAFKDKNKKKDNSILHCLTPSCATSYSYHFAKLTTEIKTTLFFLLLWSV